MDDIQIDGGIPLSGEVQVQGSKNAALPMIAAALLTKGTTVLKGCPKITDVCHMVTIIEELGGTVHWEADNLCIDTVGIHGSRIQGSVAGCMRASVIFLGSLLGRCGEAQIPYPGGCVIGKRPIDLHRKGMEQLGVEFEEKDDCIAAHAGKLHGAEIVLAYPSVGATQNLMLAAVLAEGTTVIKGCAKEPEVVELSKLLVEMGARVRWESKNTLCIEGVRELFPVEYAVPKDRIVAGTYMIATMATRGKAVLHGVPREELGALEIVLLKMGARMRSLGHVMTIDGSHAVHGAGQITTMPHPGFPTDLQSQIAAALTLARESSMIEETVFEARFAVVSELQKLHADIVVSGNRIEIVPVRELVGTTVEAKDLRGGAALVIAGLMAQGQTRLFGYEYLERGYADIVGDISQLGGRIEKVG